MSRLLSLWNQAARPSSPAPLPSAPVALPQAALRDRRNVDMLMTSDGGTGTSTTMGSDTSEHSTSSQWGGSSVPWPDVSPHAAAGAGRNASSSSSTANNIFGVDADDGGSGRDKVLPLGKCTRRVTELRRTGSQQRKSSRPGDSISLWVDSGDCSALCQLILDDRRGGTGEGPIGTSRRCLPPSLYAEMLSPFLRFETPLPNMLYAFGGRNQTRGPMGIVEMFDTWHGHWLRCPQMPARRAGGAAAVLPDGRMMVIGGYNEQGIADGLLASCDVYDPMKRKWEAAGTAAPLLRARWGHGCATLGGKVYAVGGCSLQPHAQPRENNMETLRCCEVYDPSENTWSPSASLQIPRSGSRVVALADEKCIVAVGGCDDVFGRAETQPTVELYDADSGVWTLLRSRLVYPRTTAAAVSVGGKDIFIVGGAPSLSSAEIYSVLPNAVAIDGHAEGVPADSFDNSTDRVVDDMVEGRMGCQAAVVQLPPPGGSYPVTKQQSVVVIGGERCDEVDGEFPKIKQFKCVPVFDIATGTWRQDHPVPDMTVARTAVALCVGIGHAAGTYAAGGG